MTIRARAALALVLALLFAACGSDGGTTTPATVDGAPAPAGGDDAPTVVASTSWVAAIARAAGAGRVTAIAPNNVQHPPDYEPKPSDLAAVADADFVVLAGFEGFAEQLRSAAGSDAQVLTIEPSYDVAKLDAQITTLAQAFGTTEAAKTNAAKLEGDLTAVSEQLKADLAGARPVVVSHLFTAEWVAFAGLEPAGTYGPEPITASQTADLAALKPAFVFENTHMAGSGAAVVDAAGAKEIDLVNFPGDDLDLVAVAQKNADAIRAGVSS